MAFPGEQMSFDYYSTLLTTLADLSNIVVWMI